MFGDKPAATKSGEKPPAAPKAQETEKKPRAPRQDYGFKAGAKITITEAAATKKYRGKRAEYFAILEKCNGKTIEDFDKACPANDPPRGWLRFFVQDGAASLSGGKEPEPKVAKPKSEKKEAVPA